VTKVIGIAMHIGVRALVPLRVQTRFWSRARSTIWSQVRGLSSVLAGTPSSAFWINDAYLRFNSRPEPLINLGMLLGRWGQGLESWTSFWTKSEPSNAWPTESNSSAIKCEFKSRSINLSFLVRLLSFGQRAPPALPGSTRTPADRDCCHAE